MPSVSRWSFAGLSFDDALHTSSRTRRREILVVLAPADIAGIPAASWASPQNEYSDRDLTGAGDPGIEVEAHQPLERRDRRVFELRNRNHHALFELRGEIGKRGDQHRVLRVEVKPHDPGRQVGERDNLLDRGARRTMYVRSAD